MVMGLWSIPAQVYSSLKSSGAFCSFSVVFWPFGFSFMIFMLPDRIMPM